MPEARPVLTCQPIVSWTFGISLLLLAIGFVSTWDAPLSGVHGVRQADTLFAGWSYCTEGAEFLRPRVAHRGTGTGVVIGEFPLASWAFAVPCFLTDAWNEGAVKLVIVLILMANTLLWGLFVRRRWPDRWPGWAWFGLVWVFSTHALLHFTIAIPDPLALTFVAGAGLAFLSAEDLRRPYLGRLLARIGGVALFGVAFAMRPYLVPLVFLVIAGWRWRASALALCAAVYLGWYKWWILQSEFAYYATSETTSPAELLSMAPSILGAFFEAVFRNAANVAGVLLLAIALRADRDRFLWWLAAGSAAMVLAMRGPMIIHHKYYLGAFCVLLAILMAHGARRAPPWTAIVFLLVAFLNVQHYWHGGNRQVADRVREQIEVNDVAPEDRVAVYAGDDTMEIRYLYWAKRTGWAIARSAFAGEKRCPEGAKWAMVVDDERPSIRACVSAP